MEKPFRRRDMKNVHPFVYGHVIAAFLAGAITGTFFDLEAVMVFSSVLAASAVVSVLVCWRWPGFAAAGWKLWLIGILANPLFLAAVAFSADQYECLLGQRTGWNCMFSDLGPLVAGMCLLPPIGGLLWRWWKRRGAAA
ncbi:MAG: hypothetical protein WCK95_10025 [Alphaproteobacteria bacterium]